MKTEEASVWASMYFWRSIKYRLLLEWGGTACLGIVVMLLCVFCHLTTKADHFVYDYWLMAHTPPASPDIVLVDIDDASINALGRWPWPRRFHAALITDLANDGAAAVVYDVLFTEPSADDAKMASALARCPSFLPILLTSDNGVNEAQLPVAMLAQRAAALGHINLEVDDDGIVRSVALQETSGHHGWPQLMVPVANAVRSGMMLSPDAQGARPAVLKIPPAGTSDEQRVLIPFSRNAENYRRVSFADVLAGRVSPSLLKGHIVLVGVTASGLYERFATPVSGVLGPMPGVDINADVLDMLLHGTSIESASMQEIILVSLVPLAILLAGLFRFTPLRVLILAITLCAALFAGSAVLLFWTHVWFSPIPGTVALFVVYLVWNWRRLEMTMAYMHEKLHQLADTPYLLPETPAAHKEFHGDPLEQQMALMTQATQRLQDMQRFIWDSLDSVPEPVLVTDYQGIVRIINHKGRSRFARWGTDVHVGKHIQDILGRLTFIKAINADDTTLARAKENWPALLDPTKNEYIALMTQGIEVYSNVNSHDYILRYARCTNVQNETIGWIASLFDISVLRQAQRQREKALQLLSHDMRSPQVSILTLIEARRHHGEITSKPVQATMESIERYARRALSLAENFVQLARAESKDYEFVLLDFTDLLIDATDEIWPQAQAKHIQIETQYDTLCNPEKVEHAGWVRVDRSMMTRALVNVLNNAVKYSPPGTKIICSVSLDQTSDDATDTPRAYLVCAIHDQGYGITPQEQALLFEPFRRFHTERQPQTDGVGLGMMFVKTVVSRHDGKIAVQSEQDKGTTVTISLPVVDALPEEA